MRLDDYLRAYDITGDGQIQPKEVAVCSDRHDYYVNTLLHSPGYKLLSLRWGQSGTFEYVEQKRFTTVSIPDELAFGPPSKSHDLKGKSSNPPISIKWSDLLLTARWMDEVLTKNGDENDAYWEARLKGVRVEIFTPDNKLCEARELTIQGMMNLIGMVSSGKTTLITVLSVWAARQNYHITLIVGDVISALDRAQLFSILGIKAAPVLGASNRERHMNRLHRIMRTENPELPLQQNHKGFDWLSTSCALNGLHDQMTTIDVHDRPCLDLRATTNGEDGNGHIETFACPVFSHCTFHQAQQDLVDANIWIATPASLVYTGIAPQINRERIRFAELVYRRSHLVIADEADQVQVQLDNIFSPNQTLASRGHSAWFNQLSQQVLPKLNQEGRAQLSEENVEAWCSSHEMAQMAINRVYAMLLQEKALRSEIEQDYFTAWMILEKLSTRFSGTGLENRHDNAIYRSFMTIFEQFLEDPLGERFDTQLAILAQQSITHSDKARNRDRIVQWIEAQKNNIVTGDVEIRTAALLLEFALVVAVLSDRLDRLLRDWKYAESALQLDGASSIIFHRPPDDYSAVIPVSPMGNVLAFQYIRSSLNEPGDLRFFRCLGVGRWLLLHLNDLFFGDGIAGPHVVLFSGTSWAGKSPSYHIQLPVAGVLHAPGAEVKAITEDSVFEFQPIYDKNGQPIRVSGKSGNARLNSMYEILSYYARRGGVRHDKPSRFERQCETLSDSRKRILILVGSYAEARYAREYIEDIRSDWRGQVLNLVPDDDEFESTWQGDSSSLQRGLVHQLAQTQSWILIAPLLAVERGHNILNEHNQAAIGAVYFLIRPHPRPDDIGFAIQSINRWAVEEYTNPDWGLSNDKATQHRVLATGKQFRKAAFDRWRYLLHLPIVYSTLPQREREAIIWSQLVTIWQVIGRLIRGGSSAKVYFCDAAFALNTASNEEKREVASSSLLVGIIQVLRPYFAETSDISIRDKVLVQTLYGPFYRALSKMKGLPNGI